MKRIVALLLISLMLFSIMPAVAEEGCEIVLTKQNETETGFDVMFSIKNNPEIAAMLLRINFDKDKIVPTVISKEGIFANQSVVSNIDAESGNTGEDIDGEIRVIWYKTSGLTGDGDMFKISFEYKKGDEAANATVAVNKRNLDVVDKNSQQVEYTTNTLTVTVPAKETTQQPQIPSGPSKPSKPGVVTPPVENKVTLKNKNGIEKIKYMPLYEDKTFGADKPATRYEVVEALYNLVDITATRYEDAFSDVEKKYEMPVKAFITANILDGYEDKTFKGDNTITRAELVKILTLTFGLEEDTSEKVTFTDISGHWAESYIKTFVSKKYTFGYEDNTFRPENKVTRAEVVAFVNRIINASGDLSENVPSDLEISHWAYNDILKAIK